MHSLNQQSRFTSPMETADGSGELCYGSAVAVHYFRNQSQQPQPLRDVQTGPSEQTLFYSRSLVLTAKDNATDIGRFSLTNK